MKKEVHITGLQQCQVYQLSPYEYEIRIRQHNFFAGIINAQDETFYSVKRTAKNVFRMFNGLGINGEILAIILPHFEIEKVAVQYEDELFVTTAENWLKNGIKSPFCNSQVDRQIILNFELMNMKNVKLKKKERCVQTSMFEEVNNG